MLLRVHILILPFLLQNFIEQSAAAEPPPPLPTFREAPAFRNGRGCPKTTWTPGDARAHDPAIIHIAMTLDTAYLRGSVAGVLSVLQHASCPENIVFHFVASCRRRELRRTLLSTFPYLRGRLHLHPFDSGAVRGMISSSVRAALDQPLNYARIYLAELLPAAVRRVLYLDSDLIVVDDAAALWAIDLRGRVLGAPEYCHVNLTAYFTAAFWSDPALPAAAWGGSGTGGESKGGGRERKRRRREPCYFNTGVMVIDLERWREGGHTRRVERWMRLQKRRRIYELGSLPPFLLAFAGEVEGLEHRWNQHGQVEPCYLKNVEPYKLNGN